MTGAGRRVLVVEDDPAMRELLDASLRAKRFDPTTVASGDEALALLPSAEPDVVVTDLRLPGRTSGLDVCRQVVASRPDVPVVILTAFGVLDAAIEAIRAGAYDFLTKPIDVDALELALERAVAHRALVAEVRRLRAVVDAGERYEELVGTSPPMRALFDLIGRVAASDATVLLTGESGVGKELVARAIHARSKRAAGPFVAVNCAAMPAPLLESELFGHERGAFTDARRERRGLFLSADGGTLFLDEIGDLPLALQPKLLRALEERTVRPVGGEQEAAFDVRILCATNRDLETDVKEGRFREDLYFRVEVIPIVVPPLRARGRDVLLLAQRLIERYAASTGKPVAGLTPEAAERLLAYDWPGNVRELRNAIEHAVALTRFDRIALGDLPERIRRWAPRGPPASGEDVELVTVEEVERRHVLRVLAALGGNKSAAAEVLGLDRKTLYRKLERYGAAPVGPLDAKAPAGSEATG